MASEGVFVASQRWLDKNSVAGLGLLRRHLPVVRFGPIVLVTRRGDVLPILRDTASFPLPYAQRLPGPFLLGVEGEAHRRQRTVLAAVIKPEDEQRLAELVRDEAGQRVASRADGLDVGADLVYPVLDLAVGTYLGIPGPSLAIKLIWSRHMFQDIFLNLTHQPLVKARATEAAAEMNHYVGTLIAARKAHTDSAHDDVLGRLLKRQSAEDDGMSDEEIRGNLIGLAIGWLYHGAKAPLIAMDELLKRPEALAEAEDAAAADDPEWLRRVLWEALRLRPVQAGLIRNCARDVVVAEGTDHAKLLRAGTLVFAGTHSAMHDEERVPDPGVFDATRAAGQYLIFGDGAHRCLGEAFMRSQLPALLSPLLTTRALRRAGGRAGRLRYAGPTPVGLRVRFVHAH